MASHSSTLAWKIPWTEEPGAAESLIERLYLLNWRPLKTIFSFALSYSNQKFFSKRVTPSYLIGQQYNLKSPPCVAIGLILCQQFCAFCRDFLESKLLALLNAKGSGA